MKHEIPEYKIVELEKKISHISKKCQKYGGEAVSSIKGDPYFKEIKNDGKKFKVKVYPIEITGSAKIDNWEFVATLEQHHNGNIIKRYNTEIEVPERFRFSKNICEHCHTNRKRTNLYIIHNTETGDFKQVGKSCLKLFTGGLSAEYVAAYMEIINFLDESEYDYDGDFELSGNCHYYEVEEILYIAEAIIERYGYIKADQPNSTKDMVIGILMNGIEWTEHYFNRALPSESEIYTAQNSDTAQAITSYYLSLEDNSEFIHNIKVILSERYCNKKNIGLLSYLPFGYQKATKKAEAERRQIEINSGYEYFGKIGKRYKGIPITLSVLTCYDTDFGLTYIYKMEDTENHVYTWKTGNRFEPGCTWPLCQSKIIRNIEDKSKQRLQGAS